MKTDALVGPHTRARTIPLNPRASVFGGGIDPRVLQPPGGSPPSLILKADQALKSAFRISRLLPADAGRERCGSPQSDDSLQQITAAEFSVLPLVGFWPGVHSRNGFKSQPQLEQVNCRNPSVMAKVECARPRAQQCPNTERILSLWPSLDGAPISDPAWSSAELPGLLRPSPGAAMSGH